MENKLIGNGAKKIPAKVFDTSNELAEHLADRILKEIECAKCEGRNFYLGCPSGRSPYETYVKIGEFAGILHQDLSHVCLVMMDEYVLKTNNGFIAIPEDVHYSCKRFAYEDIVDNFNVDLPLEKQMLKKNVFFPSPDNPEGYDKLIKDFGGVDLFIIASGGSDGHIAFNPPGALLDSPSRIIKIADETRTDNLGTFPAFKDLSEVPEYGVSIGLNSILKGSKELALIITGEHKQYAVQRLNTLDNFSSEWPVSIALKSQNVTAYLDKTAEADQLEDEFLNAK